VVTRAGSEARRGLLDTSALIDLELLDPHTLPEELLIGAPTLAELAAGPHATDDLEERAARQARLQWAEVTFAALPFDADAARAFGPIWAAVRASGRQPRRRVVDLQIAAIASAHALTVVTRNASDFAGLEGLVAVQAV
jgi:predicted nucleic acid-binding protein